jgi:hypothetical protein
MTCPELATGRTAVAPLDHGFATLRHDISLCNVISMGMDYLYVPSQRRLYVLADLIGIPALLLMSVLIIIMMVLMGHNLQVIMTEQQQQQQQQTLHDDSRGCAGSSVSSSSSSSGSSSSHRNSGCTIDWVAVGMLLIALTSLFATAFNFQGRPPATDFPVALALLSAAPACWTDWSKLSETHAA